MDADTLTAFLPVVIVAAYFVLRRILQNPHDDRCELPEPSPRWTDVGPGVGEIRRRSRLWGAAIVARRILLGGGALVLVAGYLADAALPPGQRSSGDLPRYAILVAMIVAGAALTPVCRALADPFYTGEVYLTDERRTGGVVGLTLRFAARVLFLPALAGFVVLPLSGFLFVGVGRMSGEDTTFGIGDAAGVLLWTVVCSLAGSLALGLDRLGLRLLSEEGRAQQWRDPRLPLLYLRNFGDDGLRITAGGASRRGLLGRFAWRRTRPFEEAFAWRLVEYGPLVAVNDPNVRLRTLGAAKTHLPPAGWQHHVEQFAYGALAVVVSAAPEAMSDGLMWELHMLATRLPHRRIVLIVPPCPPRDLQERWRRFCDAVEPWDLFAGVREANDTGAAHVLVHVPGQGWHAWGAHRRTEWTYGLAIRGALEYAVPAWRRADPRLAEAERRAAARRPSRAPGTVRAALVLMVWGAALTLVNTMLTVPVLSDRVHAAALREARQSPVGSGDMSTSVGDLEIGWFVICGLVTAALWALLARRCRKGSGWGRILALCAGVPGSLFLTVKTAFDLRAQPLTACVDLATLLVGLTSIILLWTRASARHFESSGRRRSSVMPDPRGPIL